MGTAASNPDSHSAEGLKVAIVAARYNEDIVAALIEGARACWRQHGGQESTLRVERVPGAFELPLAARALARTGQVNAVIALGCVVRGETAHFEYVAGECARGLQQVMLETGLPVSFGVLTVETMAQAQQRAASNSLNKGAEAVETALAMVHLLRRI